MFTLYVCGLNEHNLEYELVLGLPCPKISLFKVHVYTGI